MTASLEHAGSVPIGMTDGGPSSSTSASSHLPQIDPNNHVVMIDNYDSFTWNLYQYLCLMGANMTVIRSEALTVDELEAKYPDMTHLIISPGPGHPLSDSGISVPAISRYEGKIPILGVCMGLQCITVKYGGDVDQAGEYVHGKTSSILHDGKGLFKGLAQGIAGTRYHSLAARINSLPDCLETTSRTEGGIIMGLRHKEFAIESVQYHPESILSEEGKLMFANFLSWKGGKWADLDGALEPTSSFSAVKPVNNGAATAEAGAVPTILQKIEQQRILDVAKSKATPGYKPADLESLIALHVPPPLISFHQRLQASAASTSATTRSDEPHMALLAEVKRASPSKGDIVDSSSPSAPAIALSYALAGASVISVLTEPKWFKGSLDDMRAVRAAVDALPNRPAVLRKDFILDRYQIDEARVYGADTVLLIVAMLDDAQLGDLYRHAVHRGMEPLVEVNNADELERALAVGAKVIGVNNRNLHDFNVDMQTTSRIADVIRDKYPPERAREIILIALSGITGRKDVEMYKQQGVSAVLVGESLMRAKDKGAFVRELLGVGASASSSSTSSSGLVNGAAAAVQSAASAVVGAVTGSSSSPAPSSSSSFKPTAPLVKICGLKTPEAALVAADAGADLLGLILVPGSKRNVPLEQAKAIIAAVRARPSSSSSTATPPQLDESTWFSLQSSRIASHPRKPLFVGVFQNAPLSTVLHAVDTLGLDLVQLHGSEPAHWARLLPVPVIRAFHVAPGPETAEQQRELSEASRPGLHALPLLDTAVSPLPGALSGGAGRTFDWSVARRLVESGQGGEPGQAGHRLPVMLAGGLDAGNVQDGVRTVRPFAVDVSGGVETAGEKDLDKVREFVRLAKEA